MSEQHISALLEAVQSKAAASGTPGSSWTGYVAMLRYLQQESRCLPSLEVIEACGEEGIDRIFEAALEHLASAAAEILPAGGLEELMCYLNT